jgi:hypothetical protein
VYFNLCYCNDFKATLFLLIRFELSMYYLFVNSTVILFLLQNSMYVMCICLIYYGLSCDVDLPRSFMTFGGLLGLYK